MTLSFVHTICPELFAVVLRVAPAAITAETSINRLLEIMIFLPSGMGSTTFHGEFEKPKYICRRWSKRYHATDCRSRRLLESLAKRYPRRKILLFSKEGKAGSSNFCAPSLDPIHLEIEADRSLRTSGRQKSRFTRNRLHDNLRTYQGQLKMERFTGQTPGRVSCNRRKSSFAENLHAMVSQDRSVHLDNFLLFEKFFLTQ